MTDEIVQASAVLSDADRLPFVGYSVEVTQAEDEESLHACVKLSTGGQAEAVLPFSDFSRDTAGIAKASRALPLIEAMLDFLNVGGSVDDLLETAAGLSELPEISPAGLIFLTATEAKDRETFYRNADGHVLRVVQGEFAELITDEAFQQFVGGDSDEEVPDVGCSEDSGSEV